MLKRQHYRNSVAGWTYMTLEMWSVHAAVVDMDNACTSTAVQNDDELSMYMFREYTVQRKPVEAENFLTRTPID